MKKVCANKHNFVNFFSFLSVFLFRFFFIYSLKKRSFNHFLSHCIVCMLNIVETGPRLQCERVYFNKDNVVYCF